MGAKKREFVCTECYTVFEAIPGKSYLGQPKMTCPACKATFAYPLSTTSRTIDLIVLILSIVAIWFIALFFLRILFGILMVVVIISLVRDAFVAQKVRAAKSKSRKQPA